MHLTGVGVAVTKEHEPLEHEEDEDTRQQRAEHRRRVEQRQGFRKQIQEGHAQ